jgi:heme exporter protein B
MKKVFNNLTLTNKNTGLLQLTTIYTILGVIIVSLSYEYNKIKEIGIFFITVLLPLFITQTSDRIIYDDFKDGFLELYLMSLSPWQIIYNKIIELFVIYIFSYLLILPLLTVFLNLDYKEIYMISALMIINIMMSITLSILVGSCNCYFKNITLINFIINIPLILPNLILTGLIINNYPNFNNLIPILYGITFIIIPIIFFCSCFLIKNIYNIYY